MWYVGFQFPSNLKTWVFNSSSEIYVSNQCYLIPSTYHDPVRAYRLVICFLSRSLKLVNQWVVDSVSFFMFLVLVFSLFLSACTSIIHAYLSYWLQRCFQGYYDTNTYLIKPTACSLYTACLTYTLNRNVLWMTTVKHRKYKVLWEGFSVYTFFWILYAKHLLR